nr:MAG: hypothetical protein [Hubei picobirnavirus 53]
MTSNQLTLGRLREDIRHNKTSESLGFATLGETKRHNVQSEQIGFGNIGLGYAQLGESKRHNIATEEYQGEQARASATKSSADAAYTQLQIQYYLDELKVRQDNAEAALQNAESNAERVKIEQQLADIKQEMMFWEKLRIGAEAFKDVATGTDKAVDTIEGVKGLIKGK